MDTLQLPSGVMAHVMRPAESVRLKADMMLAFTTASWRLGDRVWADAKDSSSSAAAGRMAVPWTMWSVRYAKAG